MKLVAFVESIRCLIFGNKRFNGRLSLSMVLRYLYFLHIALMVGGLMTSQIAIAASYNATGWQWYSKADEENEQEDELFEDNPQQTQTVQSLEQSLKKPKKPKSYRQQLKAFQAHYEEAQAKAVLTRKVEDVAYAMYLRMFMMEQSKDYGRAFEKALLKYPHLSYELNFPTQDFARQISRDQHTKRQQQAIAQYAQSHGLFYFYKGEDVHSKPLATSIQHFADQYGITLIGVAIDGVVINEIKEHALNLSLSNDGDHRLRIMNKIKQWGVKAVPALFLYDNQTKVMQPFAYGFIAQDQMAERFLQFATNYDQKPLQGDISHEIT
jgi:conjugal transfer pilus assembly protein TraF